MESRGETLLWGAMLLVSVVGVLPNKKIKTLGRACARPPPTPRETNACLIAETPMCSDLTL